MKDNQQSIRSSSSQEEEELDELLIEYLTLLDLYQENQINLSKELKSGYFDLARTKQALGPTRIGASNFDLGECLSRIAVNVSPFKTDDITSSSSFNYELSPSPSSLDPLLTSTTPLITPPTSTSPSNTIETPPSSSLRSRSKTPIASTPSATKTTVISSVKEPQPRPISRDPIYQFSAFPPPALRDTQKSFSRFLIGAVEGVKIRDALGELEGRIEGVKRGLR